LLNEIHIRVRGAAEKQFVNSISHDAKGQRTSIEYGNDTQTLYQYDPLTYRLIRLTTRHQLNSKVYQDIVYTYDPTGNITSIQDEAQQTLYFNNTLISPHTHYSYDSIYRLIRAEGREHISMHRPPNESDSFRQQIPLPSDELAMQNCREYFEYDEVGNMLRLIHHGGRGSTSLRWTKAFDYATASNQMTSMTVDGSTQNFTYDIHGLMETLPHLNGLSWDFENGLESIDKGGGGKVYYNYDAEGNRVRKVWEKPGGRVEERVYIGSVEVFSIQQGATEQLVRETLHINDDKKRIALIETRTDSNPQEQLVRYQYNNHLGTAALELDHTGDIISYEEYYAFGSTSFQSGRSTAEVNLKRYRYTGKERDEESGLYYHGARYYVPWLARWTAADPAGLEDGPNVYTYVRNNPINNHDPTGLINWRTVAIIAAVVVVGIVVTVATAGAAGPIVAGAVASIGISGTAATVTTAVVVGAVAGAAGGAASELTRQVASGEEVSGRAIGRAALEGAAFGAVTGGVAAGATAFAASARGAATIARATETASRASSAVARATPAVVRQVATATARGVATVGRGAATAARAARIPDAVRAVGRGLQTVEAAGGRVGLAGARSMFSSGSRGARTVARYAATGGDLAETFGSSRTAVREGERAISRASTAPNLGSDLRFGDLSSGAKRLVRSFERTGSADLGSGARATDIARASEYFGLEVGVFQSQATGSLRAALSGETGILRGVRRPGEVHVAHTHPVRETIASHLDYDVRTATDVVEAVIDWGDNITYFNRTGILTNPATRPINALGYVVGH
jgi:RHS repeat-associated protein